jgi:type II secretory pathway component PulC
MKHPFWIINSSLFFLLLFVLGFVYFFRSPLPEREHIELAQTSKPITTEKLLINITKIYEQDLFDTYKKEEPVAEASQLIEPLPEPPQPQTVSIPEQPEPQFLEPINVTLKGIMTVGSDSGKNRAIIEDNKTNQEAMYRVGDSIEDARLIRIFNNKIILLRTNGQQEVLYLREQDAKNDPAYAAIDKWDEVVKKTTDNDYLIDIKQFTHRIHNLGQIVDILSLTTAYEKGVSIGCRIGMLDEKSFGPQIGLQKGDIILSINNIPANNTENRLAIYQNIMSLANNDVITVTMLRNEAQQIMRYTLQTEADTLENILTPQKHSEEELQEKNVSKLQKKYSFAPTMKEIRTQEKERMLNKGKEHTSSSTRAKK